MIDTESEQSIRASAGRLQELVALRARLDRQAEALGVDGGPMPDQRDRFELVAEIERQDRALAEQQRELTELHSRLDRQDRALRDARAVLALVLRSRVYRLLRAFGRWGWLEHRIRSTLRLR